MATSCKSPRYVPSQTGRLVTTLAAVAKAQTERLGRRIKERREELDLKQREVAARMAASPSTDAQMVSKWERGEHRPNDDNLEILADALETTVADLVSGPLSERPAKAATPDAMAALDGKPAAGDELHAQLDRIEQALSGLAEVLDAMGTQNEARAEQFDSKLEALRRALDRRVRRAG
jgi:transcriptional regulator with XRE-family HTH domain